MSFPHITTAAMAFFAALTFHPHSALAEKFTGKVFAERSQESQDAYIQTSIMMAGVITSQTNPSVSKCIDEWYVIDSATTKSRNSLVRETIANYKDHHPTAIIFAVLKSQCGDFK